MRRLYSTCIFCLVAVIAEKQQEIGTAKLLQHPNNQEAY